MNEKYKKIGVGICFFILVLGIVIQSITCNYSLRRADNTINTLTTELADTQRRLREYRAEVSDSRRTITECHDGIGRVREGLDRQSGTVTDIIKNLKTVRAEVENMENTLNLFYGKYGYNDNNTYSKGEVDDEEGNTESL